MRSIRILTLSMAVALVASTSCTFSEMMPEGETKAWDGELRPVTVKLKLNLEEEIDGTPGTKSIDDPASAASTEIRNLCVLQYAGTEPDAPLVGGDSRYFSKDITDPEEEGYLAPDYTSIKLADSWGATHTLVILANTFGQITPPGDGEVKTLGDMLSALSGFRTVTAEADVFGHAGDGSAFPIDETYYQRLNAVAVTKVINGKKVYGTLRRSMSRINVEIENSGADNLQILSAQLRNVSQKDYYVTNYTYLDPADHTTVRDNLTEEPFHDAYVGAVPKRMDYPVKSWIAGGGADGGIGTANYTWYVPCNMRGTDPGGNTLPEMKGICANAQGATYLEILATYGTNNDPVEYRFYLGSNLTDNFDLNPGSSYNYKFTFDGKGRPSTDDRMAVWGEDFNVDANCYMLTPPPTGTAVYSFNVVHRINTFWGSPEADRYGFYDHGAGEYPDSYIDSGEEWKARILWSECPYDRDVILTKKNGTGGGAYMDDNQRVQITVPAGTEPGNFVIAVWTGDDPTNILWSWHIWITDYRPDDARNLHPIEGTYVYKVTGGEVHRYGGDMWTTGRYKDAFIMDRNVGAISDAYSYAEYTTGRGGDLLYEFGRKDPFFSRNSGYTYAYADETTVKYSGTDVSINASTHRGTVGNNVGCIQTQNTGQGRKNTLWAIKHPTQIVATDDQNSRSWSEGDMFNAFTDYTAVNVSKVVWNDPRNNIRGENEEKAHAPSVGDNQNKSIFDPCPPGWILPVHGFADAINASNFKWNVEDQYGRSRGTGRTYFPEADGSGGYDAVQNNPDRQSIFFPANGWRYVLWGAMYAMGGDGAIWTSTRQTNHSGYSLGIYSNRFSNAELDSKGFSVRCIRE